jgi:hypothetical protein
VAAMRIKNIRTDRVMKSLTGLKISEFKDLSVKFEEILNEKPKKGRKRAIGGGRKHSLDGAIEKLFFILMYIKCYATFDVLGFIYDVHRGQPCRWVAELLPKLEQVLDKEVVLPERKIQSVEEFQRLFPEIRQLFIDGTERPTRRSKNNEQQKADYSGKKKRHTKKNLIASTKEKKILVLSPTVGGSNHDYTEFKESNLGNNLPPKVEAIVDLGFQGIEKDYPDLKVSIPDKKPKGKELSTFQKLVNKTISSVRVVAEHAIGGVKRFGSVVQVYRNRRPDMDDKLMLIACGLWNFHLNAIA